jgi:subtilisin family serine protease
MNRPVPLRGEVLLKKLQTQVERINDETPGRERQVLVRLVSRRPEGVEVVQKVSDVLRQRRMLLHANALVPAPRARFERSGTGTLPRSSGSMLSRMRASLVGQLASLALPHALDELKDAAERLIQPLLELPVLRRARGRTEENARKLWAARSVLLSVTKDELAQLPRQALDGGQEIGEIHTNRPLSVPAVTEVKEENLPRSIVENQVCAWGLQTINALAAWGAFEKRGEGMTVAVLDTGVDFTHPDLQGKMKDWAEFDRMGRLVPDSIPRDTHGHGSHVAGIICGGTESGRHIGVAPKAKIAAALVLNGDQGGTDAQILAAIDWAIEKRVDVINMSLGELSMRPETPTTYSRAILSALLAGIPVVTAIGNEGSQTSGAPGSDVFAYAVGATDWSNRVAGFSGGRTQIIHELPHIPPESLPLTYMKPEVTAPGVACYSCRPGGKWTYLSGTSMAAPHASGAFALLLSATNIQAGVAARDRGFLLQDLMTSSVEELGESGQDHRFGYGRIDVLKAIGTARSLNY